MKIEVRIENGKPIIIFPDTIDRDKSISVFTIAEMHGTANRAYIRSLKKPETEREIADCHRVLRVYCNHVLATACDGT